MTAPRTTVWKLDAHSSAKHAILRRYLQAWAPILAQGGFPRFAYIDGFSGPGRYEHGEDGSPIIALKAAIEHAPLIKGRFDFLFVEEKRDRADFLEHLVETLDIPSNFNIQIRGGVTFEDAFDGFRRTHIDSLGKLPPTFAFIDPFGWKGVPFSIVKYIMSHRSCEVLVTFMYEEINRFIGHPDQEINFDSFFGTRDWRSGIDIEGAIDRNRFLHDLYRRQLVDVAGAKYVRSFKMQNSTGLTDYYLFYATNNILGLKKMKEAMWSVDQSGEFRFSDATDPDQLILLGGEPFFDHLSRLIVGRFARRTCTVAEVEEFVLTETAFRETHFKRQVLGPLELKIPPGLQVVGSPQSRPRGTYADKSLRLKFT